jgi:hypothetical protein
MLYEGVLLVGGCAAWLAAIIAEYAVAGRRVLGELPTPCSAEREYSGYNYVLVGLPISLILLAETRILGGCGGSLGLTCIVEAACFLGMTGYSQIRSTHLALCIVAGVSSTLVCTNAAWRLGIIMGAPLLLLSVAVLFCHSRWYPQEDGEHPATTMSVLYWMMDVWLIVGRVGLLFPDPGWVDHFAFDIASFFGTMALGACLGVALGVWGDSWLPLGLRGLGRR